MQPSLCFFAIFLVLKRYNQDSHWLYKENSHGVQNLCFTYKFKILRLSFLLYYILFKIMNSEQGLVSEYDTAYDNASHVFSSLSTLKSIHGYF